MPDTLTLVASLRARPGAEEELGARLAALVEPTRGEEGCIDYALHRSHDESAVYMLYENWRSREDLDAHFETAYLRDFLGRVDGLLAEPMELRFFKPLRASV